MTGPQGRSDSEQGVLSMCHRVFSPSKWYIGFRSKLKGCGEELAQALA